MTLTAAQIREARAFLGWTTSVFGRRARISFAQAIKVQDDEGLRSLGDLRLQAIRLAFERSGVEFKANDAVSFRGSAATLTAAQVRRALDLLGWRSAMLVRRARVSYAAALQAKADGGIAALPGADAWAIRPACDAGRRPGARARVP